MQTHHLVPHVANHLISETRLECKMLPCVRTAVLVFVPIFAHMFLTWNRLRCVGVRGLHPASNHMFFKHTFSPAVAVAPVIP